MGKLAKGKFRVEGVEELRSHVPCGAAKK